MTAPSPAHVYRRMSHPHLLVHLTLNEAGKGVKLFWRRRGAIIATLIASIIMYLAFTLVVGGGQFSRPLMVLTLPGLMAYVVAVGAALQGSAGISEEINGGTLEQSQLGPGPQSLQMFGRLSGPLFEGLFVAAVLGIGLALIFGLSFEPRPTLLLPVLLTVLDGIGYGLLMTALTLRVASIGALVHLLNGAVLFLGGTILPIMAFPDVTHAIARFIPTALGVEVINTVLSGRPLSATWSDGTLPWLIVHAIAFVTVGWVLYLAFFHRARREGGLSPR